MYQGLVYDRLKNNQQQCVYKSRKYGSYYDAHKRAEKKAKSLGCGDRFEISVWMID